MVSTICVHLSGSHGGWHLPQVPQACLQATAAAGDGKHDPGAAVQQ